MLSPIKLFTDLLFPPLCLHCSAFIEKKGNFFCATCNHFFELLPPQERCYYCFQLSAQKVCRGCRKGKNKIPSAFCFEKEGPLETFFQKVQAGSPAFIKLAAAFMLLQWQQTRFPLPRGILPLYEVPFSQFFKKIDPLYALVQELSRQLQVPIVQNGDEVLLVQISYHKKEVFSRQGMNKVYLLALME